VSGAALTLICTPLDVIKNQWQGSTRFAKDRTKVTTQFVIRSIYKASGPLAFWRGALPAFFVLSASNFIFFSLFEIWREKNWPAYAACKARLFAVLTVAPMEYMRTRLQASMGTSARHILVTAFEEEGLGSMWRGIVPTLLRDIPFSAVYWTAYEKSKTDLLPQLDSRLEERHPFVRNFAYPFVLGLAAGTAGTVLSHPFDVVKTTIQATGKMSYSPDGHKERLSQNSLMVLRGVIARGGWRGLTVGLLPRVAKVAPTCAISLGIYESFKWFLVE